MGYYFFQSLGDNNPHNLIPPDPLRYDIETEISHLLRRRILFHDQEPIIFNNLIKDWHCKIAQVNRLNTNHILSNSELNSIDKDLLIEKSGWADFYWFSNAFLSSDWYRYYRYATYFESSWSPTKKFSSYNRILPNREHRLIIANHLYKNFKDQIILSKHSENNNNNLFINTITNSSENYSYTIHEKDFVDSFCHIVTERIYYENRIHLTEKVFRPIICCRPFILVSSSKSLQYLKNYGFKTFNSFWNEDYDLVDDHNLRMEKILKIINYLGSLSHNEILNLLVKMQDILIYNRNHFYGNFQKLVTQELFQNLDTALNQKNSKKIIFKQIIENLTLAEINLIQNSNIELDFQNTDEDYFQMDLFSKTLNNNFNKFNIDETTIRPIVQKYLKHFKYYFVCINALSS